MPSRRRVAVRLPRIARPCIHEAIAGSSSSNNNGCSSKAPIGMNLESIVSKNPGRAGSARKFITIEKADEVRHWARSLGCSQDRLREAVHEIGRSAAEVRLYLRNRKR